MLGIGDALTLAKKATDLVQAGITIDLRETVMDLRLAVMNAKDEVLALREENQQLKAQLAANEDWAQTRSKYKFVQAPGGAMVYHAEDPPEHYACPHCFGESKVSVLQDKRVVAGDYFCPACKSEFPVQKNAFHPDRDAGPSEDWSGGRR
jgi:predicted RNA-binding Zn-ribbon protein involved in translation (DUF1610 family)